MTTHATDLARRRHFLSGDLAELLEEMPRLHQQPAHVQHAWVARKRRLLAAIVSLESAEAGGQEQPPRMG